MTPNLATATLGELISLKANIHEKLRDANRVVAALKEDEDMIDAAIIVQLDKAGTTRGASSEGSVSINETQEPNVDSWESLQQHILNTKDFSLLQRRVSATAFRELLKAGTPPPGTSARPVRRVNFRSA